MEGGGKDGERGEGGRDGGRVGVRVGGGSLPFVVVGAQLVVVIIFWCRRSATLSVDMDENISPVENLIFAILTKIHL